MARKRDPRREEAKRIWLESNKEKKLKEIASELGVKDSQIRKWKSLDNWDENNAPNQKERSLSSKGNVPFEKAQEKPKNTQNRAGNPNPSNKFTKRNQVARIHGLRSKYFSDVQREIMEDFQDIDIADQLWIQIEIKFSAIIHLQSTMWVPSADDHLKVKMASSSGEAGESESYKVAFAHERFESYINAQSRAMAEYRNLVKQFNAYAHEEDERRLKLDKLQAEVNKVQAEATIAQSKADKLTANSQANELMQSLIDVMAEGDTDEEEVAEND